MGGLRGALAVRVNDGSTDRHVTRYCSGLKFTKTAPGGHHSMSFNLVVPRNTFTDLGPADGVWLYDARTGATIFGKGYLENPTPVDGPDGQQYDVSAMGGQALANDESRPLIYVDASLDAWLLDTAQSSASATSETGTDSFSPAFQHVSTILPGGSVIGTGGNSQVTNSACQRAGMNLGSLYVGARYSGKTDANYGEYVITPSGVVSSRSMSTAAAGFSQWVTDPSFPTGTRSIMLRLVRLGAATNVADDQTWTHWVDVRITGQRMDRNGALLTGAAGLVSSTQVLTSQVAEDLLGRLLTFCDPVTAVIDTSTYGITQLAYPDGVKAAGVLNDLEVFEPDLLWEILESGANDLHRFNYRAWPTTPRYEVSVSDGWRQTGSDVDLCNRVLVSWTDSTGAQQITEVTAASLGLVGIGLPVDALGSRIKDAEPITLPEGKGSAENALQVGAALLRDKIDPPKAGTVTVRGPILDRLTGCMVMPWELEPGYLCRVRETGDDLRVTQVDYDDDSCSSLLTLGKPAPTNEQRLAKLARAVPTVAAGV